MARTVGITPFIISPKRVIAPNFFPMALVTLVAPMFPLPTFLRSTFPKYFANITPVGMEPIKYEIMERNIAGRKMSVSGI